MSGGGSDDDSDKQHEPSQKKLDDARKKGEVPRSADLITTGAYAGLLLALVATGPDALSRIGQSLSGLIARADSIDWTGGPGSGGAMLGTVMAEIGLALAPIFLLPMALILLSAVGQQAFLITGSKIQPKLNRLSILSNAKNKFGRNGLFEFAKSAAKLMIFSVILFVFLGVQMPRILSSVAYTPGEVARTFLSMSVAFLGVVLLVSLTIGGLDFLWQRAEHMRKNRMSRKELTDEQKDSEGDPYMKQARRQKGYEIAMNQMMADVPDASVVIVNPTHYAVALKWDRTSPGAPVCVAKGVDLVAARIREAATEAGVPIHSDPPTARAIHAVVEVGQEIRPEQYAAVAVAIRFAEDMTKKARSR